MGGPGQEVQKGEMRAAGRGAREGGTVKRWAGDAARASRQEEAVGGQSQVPAGMAGQRSVQELCGGPGVEVSDLHPLLSREPGGHPPMRIYCWASRSPRAQEKAPLHPQKAQDKNKCWPYDRSKDCNTQTKTNILFH